MDYSVKLLNNDERIERCLAFEISIVNRTLGMIDSFECRNSFPDNMLKSQLDDELIWKTSALKLVEEHVCLLVWSRQHKAVLTLH